MVSAWFRLRQGTVELQFRLKLDHVETETSRHWISSVICSDLQSDDVFFQKQWAGPRPPGLTMVVAGLTVWSESSQVHSAFPPQPTRYWASKLITIGWGSLHSAKPDHAVQHVVSALLMRFCFECIGIVPVGK